MYWHIVRATSIYCLHGSGLVFIFSNPNWQATIYHCLQIKLLRRFRRALPDTLNTERFAPAQWTSFPTTSATFTTLATIARSGWCSLSISCPLATFVLDGFHKVFCFHELQQFNQHLGRRHSCLSWMNRCPCRCRRSCWHLLVSSQGYVLFRVQ